MIALLFIISNAFADPLSATVKKGEIVPFSGTLLNEEAVAKIIASQEAQDSLCDAKIKLEVEKKESELILNNEILSGRVLSCERSLTKLDNDYTQLVKKYNRKSAMMPYVATGGFVGGVALTILIAGAINGAVQ